MNVKDEAEDILENVQEVVSAKGEAESVLGNIQPPLTLDEVHETTEKVARTLTKNRIGFYALGMGVGAVTGYFVAKRMLKTKYSQIADDEIAEMREHYQAKARALEAEAAKRPVDEIVKERGYSAPEGEAPPMAVPPPAQPPITVVEDEDEEGGEPPNFDPERSEETRNLFQEAAVTHEWDWHEERKKRSPDIPYVIHYDERYETEEYSDVTLTLYDGDGVICNERDEIVDPNDVDRLLGEKNLERFGHGSNDAAIVYIRNDELQIVYEVVKSPNSYAEEVHGFSHDDAYRGNLERMHKRERDEQDG
jgi:hypothetical protein